MVRWKTLGPKKIGECPPFRKNRDRMAYPGFMLASQMWATLYNLVGVVKRHVECLRSASCCAGAELEFFLLIGKLLMLLLLTRLQLAFRIWRWKLVPPTIYSVSGTMIRCSDSRLFGRQGAQSAQRWTVFHQGGPRAALHANQLRVIRRAAQHPVHPHGQLASHGNLRHRGPTAKLQTLIHAFQCGIEARRRVTRFHQQRTHHRIALLADRSQPLLSARTVFLRIQPQITHHLLTAVETLHWPDDQHESQRRHWSHSRMRHQSHRQRLILCRLLYRQIELCRRRRQLIEHPQQFLSPIAGPWTQC